MEWRRAMGPDGTDGPRRNGSGHLTPEEREELGHEAVLMHARGKTYREIAKELGVNKNTVGGLIAEEYGRRRASRAEEHRRAVAAYRALQRDGWRRLAKLAENSSSQSVSGMHSSIRSAQERIDKLFGLEAPTKSEHKRTTTTTVDLSKMPDADAIAFAQIVERNPEVFGPMMAGEPEPWEEPW